ncbi:peptidoglycan-binding domain-containing protein [Peribacillus frigoritolerans]|nr:peptidoglycan-binding domain-containing protein [Peribacillus frigoritolerans]
MGLFDVKCKKNVVCCFLFVSCFFRPNSIFAQEILHNGSQGQIVYDLQENLKKMGYFNSQPTGYYGSITDHAVKQLQLDSGLLPDGVFGFQTQQKIK